MSFDGGMGETRLEFARQIRRAVHGLDLGFAAGDEFVVDPDFVIRARFWQAVVAEAFRRLVNLFVRRRTLGQRRRHHVTIHVAARRDRIEQHGMQTADQGLQVTFEHRVILERLASRETELTVRGFVRQRIERQPLFRRATSAGQAHAQHKRERLFLAGLLQRKPLIAVVLKIKAVEFRELPVVVRDSTGGRISDVLRDGSAEEIR
jgi:hypothetical protein